MSEREMSTDDIASPRSAEGPRDAAQEPRDAEDGRSVGAQERQSESAQTEVASSGAASEGEPLLEQDEEAGFLRRWEDIQAGFVDEPRQAVQEADALVAGLMKRLAETFSEARTQLEGQWDRGDRVSTEELRITLQRYRSFFTRLLSA